MLLTFIALTLSCSLALLVSPVIFPTSPPHYLVSLIFQMIPGNKVPDSTAELCFWGPCLPGWPWWICMDWQVLFSAGRAAQTCPWDDGLYSMELLKLRIHG